MRIKDIYEKEHTLKDAARYVIHYSYCDERGEIETLKNQMANLTEIVLILCELLDKEQLQTVLKNHYTVE